MKKLDPYDNPDNWLTKKELDGTREEGFSDGVIVRDFNIKRKDLVDLDNKLVKKVKIGKRSPHFDYNVWVEADKNNPLSRAGWWDSRKPLVY